MGRRQGLKSAPLPILGLGELAVWRERGTRLRLSLATYIRLSPRCGSENRSPSVGNRAVQPDCKRSESGCGAVPAQLVNIVEEIDIGPERSKGPEKQCVVPLTRQRACEGARVGHVYAPVLPVRGNGFKMAELLENGSRRLRTPASQSRITICCIAD